MTENSDLLPNFMHEEFEMQMRGYSRRQVDEYVARRNNEVRDLEQRLARALDESEHLGRELSALRQQALAGRPAHEEVSERIAQILKLADDEAKAQKSKADEEIARQRSEAQQEADRVRAEAREQAERMLTAAQEQAEQTIAAARAEADKVRTAAHAEAERLTAETRARADQVMAEAKGQAKRVTDEANARAAAIHDGAERRLNLLSTRHADTVRRLTGILEGVQELVAAEAERMSLEEEVEEAVAGALSAAAAAGGEEEQGAPGRDREAPGRDIDRDLDAIAPPIAGSAVTGPGPRNGSSALPPAGDGAGNPVRPLPAGGHVPPFGGPDAPADPFGDRGLGFPGALEAQARAAGDALGPQLPPPPPMPRRLAVPPEDGQRGGDTIAMPAGQQRPGPAIPLGPGPAADDQNASAGGLIDPDEPTEGVRLVR
jgi:cell division septum initiation protein DivIVA